MSATYEINVKVGVVTKTTVINTIAQLDQSLRDLLHCIDTDSQCVVGLDIEKECRPYPGAVAGCGNNQVVEKVTVLKLCYDTTCLIIQLLQLEEAPCSLSAFLQLNWISFAGVGIKHCLEALEMNYGIKCRNAVDLGQLAAILPVKEGKLKDYGLLDLVRVFFQHNSVVKMKLMNSSPAVALTYWGATVLSEQQIEAASLHAYACFYLAKNFLVIEDGYNSYKGLRSSLS